MKRTVRLAARIESPWIVDFVLGRVPAMSGEIEPAGERDAIVNHDDLLMLRGAQRNLVVETEVHALRRLPLQRERRKWLALRRIQQRVVPQQQIYVERRALFHQSAEEFGQFGRIAIFRLSALTYEAGATV